MKKKNIRKSLVCLCMVMLAMFALSMSGIGSYAETTYTENYTDNTGQKGIKVKAQGRNGAATVDYWNWIDITSDSTVEILDMYFVPDNPYNAEANTLIIQLTDILDEEQTLSLILATGSTWYSIPSTYGFVSLENNFTRDSYGFISGESGAKAFGNSSFGGAGYTNMGYLNAFGWNNSYCGLFSKSDEIDITPLKVVYDKGKIYVNTNHMIADIFDSDFLTANYNTYSALPEQYANFAQRYTSEYVSNLFSSGRAKLSIKLLGVSNYVSFSLRRVNEKATKQIEDNTSPYIFADLKTHAIKDVSYTLPQLSVIDNTDENISDITEEVFAPGGSQITLSGRSFIPSEAGDYIYRITARDESGNVELSELEFTCFDELPQSTFVIKAEATVDAQYDIYEYVTFPSFIATTDLSVTGTLDTFLKISVDGNVVDQFKCGEEAISYRLTKAGSYSISYTATDAFGNISTLSLADFNVRNVPVIFPIDKAYVNIGSYFTVTSQKCIYNNNEYDTTYQVTSPSGKSVTVANGRFLANERGEYRIKYSASISGYTAERVQIVEAVYLTDSIISTSGKIEIARNYDVPNNVATDRTGLLLTVNGNSSFDLKNKIDLSRLGANQNIIQFLSYNIPGKKGATSYTITLTDAYNSRKKVSVTVLAHSGYSNLAYVQLNYDGRPLARYSEYGGIVYDWPKFGCLVEDGMGRINPSNYFYLQCNYEEREFYINCFGSRYLLLDLDNGEQVGFGKEWDGFTTGEVYLSMAIDTPDYTGILLTEIGGQRLDGISIEDNTPPQVYFVYPECFVENNGVLPVAQVNKKYNLLTATAYDLVFGETDVEYILRYGNENENLYSSVTNGAFTPTRVGTYHYTIKATDLLGNKVEYNYSFDCLQNVEKISVDFENYNQQTAIAGTYFRLPKLVSTGGSGEVKISYDLYMNNKKVYTDDIGEIFLDTSLPLRLVVSAKDYIGTEIISGAELTIPVIIPENPVIIIDGMPDAIVADTEITLPDFTAVNYNFPLDSADRNAYKMVSVNGTMIYSEKGDIKIGSLKYTVGNVSSIIVKYSAGISSSNILSEKTFVIPVIQPDNIRNFFTAYNYDSTCAATTVSSDVSSKGVTFVANGNKGIKFVNPVSAANLNLTFSGIEGKNYQQSLVIILTDYENERISVSFVLTQIDGVVYLNINGRSSKLIRLTGSLNSIDDYISIAYAYANNSLTDNAGNALARIETDYLGNRFNGFPSGLVRVAFEFRDVPAGKEASINIYRISNQTLGMVTMNDIVGPQIWLERQLYSGTVRKGDTLVIPKAKAQDVLFGKSNIVVTVRFGSSVYNSISSKSTDTNYTITFDRYGYYRVIYTATDKNGNTSQQSFVYYCRDDVAPQLTIKSGTIPKSVTSGMVIELPEAEVNDNYSDVTLSVLLVSPDGSTVKLTGSTVTLTKKGKYQIVYFATDYDYNVATIVYDVEVK